MYVMKTNKDGSYEFELGRNRKKGRYKQVVCKDGFSMSVQANELGYCDPKNNEGPYSHVEVGIPSSHSELLRPYMDGDGSELSDVYGYVPVHVVQMVIDRHGGMVEGELPPFKFDPSLSGMFNRKDYVGE